MAVSTYAAYTGGGIKMTCILHEGTPTVTDGTFGIDGMMSTGISLSSSIKKNEWVTLDVDTSNTYASTHGLPVVKAMANGTVVIGQVISEPKWVVVPPTTASANTWAKKLAGQYYRVATVEFFGVCGVAKAIINTANQAAIVPGVSTTLQIDASDTTALATSLVDQGPVLLSVVDHANAGNGMFSFHYVAQEAGGTYNILVGFVGGQVVVVA